MLPTPSTSHVNYDRIYEPAEDSFLLLDTLSSTVETTFLRHRFPTHTPSPVVLEVGTGSGVVLAFVTTNAEAIFGRPDIAAIGTDVNAFACEAATQTIRNAIVRQRSDESTAGQFSDCVLGDLATALMPGSVDMLIFNPPYVPTETLPQSSEDAAPSSSASQDVFARDSHLLALSYAGGVDGMQTTNRLLDQLSDVLSERGVAYVLLCKQNRPGAVLTGLRQNGWTADLVGISGKKAGWERLCIIRIWRT